MTTTLPLRPPRNHPAARLGPIPYSLLAVAVRMRNADGHSEQVGQGPRQSHRAREANDRRVLGATPEEIHAVGRLCRALDHQRGAVDDPAGMDGFAAPQTGQCAESPGETRVGGLAC